MTYLEPYQQEEWVLRHDTEIKRMREAIGILQQEVKGIAEEHIRNNKKRGADNESNNNMVEKVN